MKCAQCHKVILNSLCTELKHRTARGVAFLMAQRPAVMCCVETSGIDGSSCVVTLARCLDNAICYASLRRVKSDCVWNDMRD